MLKATETKTQEAERLTTLTLQLGTRLAVGCKMDLILLCQKCELKGKVQMWNVSCHIRQVLVMQHHQLALSFSLSSFLFKFLNKAVEIFKYGRSSS